MRETKFRAKEVATGEWLIGSLQPKDNEVSLAVFFACLKTGRLINETLGQYIGLPDKDGKEIYEGDIIKLTEDELSSLSVVVYNQHQAAFMLRWISCHADSEDFMHASYFHEIHPDRIPREVIGNIYENKELLK